MIEFEIITLELELESLIIVVYLVHDICNII